MHQKTTARGQEKTPQVSTSSIYSHEYQDWNRGKRRTLPESEAGNQLRTTMLSPPVLQDEYDRCHQEKPLQSNISSAALVRIQNHQYFPEVQIQGSVVAIQ